jgi:hypothetical protein
MRPTIATTSASPPQPSISSKYNIKSLSCNFNPSVRQIRQFYFGIMPPTLLLIRHAQALHNVANDWSLHDPPLSTLGEEQCAELQQALKQGKLADKVELIVVSAQRRTLQTAKLALTWLFEDKKIPVLPDAGWQGKYRTNV